MMALQKSAVTLSDIERHVIDDAIELIATVGVGNPLMHTHAIHAMHSDRQRVALFLRQTLGRQAILIGTRLHAPKGSGKTGETASIESYIHYAETENVLSTADANGFRALRKAIVEKLERDGIKISELVDYRHSELAHSLHSRVALTNKLASLPIWDFADETFKLVLKIERAVSGKARLDAEFQDWLDRGLAFWPEAKQFLPADFDISEFPERSDVG